MKIMAVLAVLLAAALFIGAASAADTVGGIVVNDSAGTVEDLDYTAGDNFWVNLTLNAITENGDKLNVTYNSITKQVTLATGTLNYVAGPFTAVVGQTAITVTKASDATGDYIITDPTAITVTAAPPQFNVKVAAPGPEIIAGTFALVEVDGSTITPLSAGITFTTEAGDTLTTTTGGRITVESTTPSGLYQNNGYNFTVKTATPTTGISLTGDDTVIVGDTYTLTIAAAGSYFGESATVDFGDGTTPSTITTLAITQNQTHTYTVADGYTINVTVNGKSFTKTVTAITGPTSVDVGTHGTAFVYQTV